MPGPGTQPHGVCWGYAALLGRQRGIGESSPSHFMSVHVYLEILLAYTYGVGIFCSIASRARVLDKLIWTDNIDWPMCMLSLYAYPAISILEVGL